MVQKIPNPGPSFFPRGVEFFFCSGRYLSIGRGKVVGDHVRRPLSVCALGNYGGVIHVVFAFALAEVGEPWIELRICVVRAVRTKVGSRTATRGYNVIMFSAVHADVAQLVAHHLAKVRVASSSLVIRSGTLTCT